MNPEEIETVINVTTPNIVDVTDFNEDQSPESQGELTEDPLADPLSTINPITETKCDVTCDEKETNDPKKFAVRPEPIPSCSKNRPPSPNFELDDLEDLIQSSRICTKIEVLNPEPSTSFCCLRNDDSPVEVIEESSEDEDEGENVLQQEKVDPMSFLEDFEDQIEQTILNKTDLNKTVDETIEVLTEISTKDETYPQVNLIPEEIRPCEDLPFEKVATVETTPVEPETVLLEPTLIETPSVEIEIIVEPGVKEPDFEEVFPVISEDRPNGVADTQVDQDAIVNSSQTEVLVTPEAVPVGRDEEDGRSDGSDSGLGSEPSHNGSALLDKSLSGKKLPDPPAKGNLKRRSSEQIESCNETKRSKKGIQFEGVTVYSFPRQQGFSCVPSQGGCTLGMANQHCNVKYYTLTEHSAEQRRNHRHQLSDLNPRSSSSDDSESEYEPTDSSSEADSEVYGFLQPVSARQRRALLKSAGVRKIDVNEKDECKMIRTSREVCGCTCRVYCDPDTCACSQAGIKCQVDRPNFPCGCTREGCGNVVGRVEFSPMRVRTHYIHTVMRLQMENKQDRLRSSTNAASTASSQNYKQWQVQQQQQSNIRQVPSRNTGNTACVDGPVAQTECDFSLIYDNSGSISSEMVTTPPTPDLRYATYQSETPSYTNNHIIDYVPKPSTSYPSTSSYDPNTYMTSYQAPEQQTQPNQYIEVPYNTLQPPSQTTYQIHSYDTYMQSQLSYAGAQIYNQYPTQPTTPYIYHNGYLQGQLMCETMYPGQVATQTHQINSQQQQQYDAPQTGNNNCNNIIPAKSFESTSNMNQTPPNPNPAVVTSNNNDNLCEIIKKGIVETVSG